MNNRIRKRMLDIRSHFFPAQPFSTARFIMKGNGNDISVRLFTFYSEDRFMRWKKFWLNENRFGYDIVGGKIPNVESNLNNIRVCVKSRMNLICGIFREFLNKTLWNREKRNETTSVIATVFVRVRKYSKSLSKMIFAIEEYLSL